MRYLTETPVDIMHWSIFNMVYSVFVDIVIDISDILFYGSAVNLSYLFYNLISYT
jgi:hypothetical protein